MGHCLSKACDFGGQKAFVTYSHFPSQSLAEETLKVFRGKVARGMLT